MDLVEKHQVHRDVVLNLRKRYLDKMNLQEGNPRFLLT